MAVISTYSDLVTSVQNYLARSDLAADVPGFIQNWESRFYRQPLNHGWWMEAELDETIASSVIPVPDDFLNLKFAYVNGSPASRLEYVSCEQLYGRYAIGDSTGVPVWMSRDRTNFVFGPSPDSAYAIKGTYWAKPTALRDYADDATEHWIIVNAPDLALYGALLEAEPFLKNDSRIVVWKSFYTEAVSDYRDLMSAEKHTMPGQEVLA